MIIIKKESDIKKLKLGDPRISQEELDLADKGPSEDIVSVKDKWNKLVDKHIESQRAKLLSNNNIESLPCIGPKSKLKLNENGIFTISDIKESISIVKLLLKLSDQDYNKLLKALQDIK